jgi:hypothetical protein
MFVLVSDLSTNVRPGLGQVNCPTLVYRLGCLKMALRPFPCRHTEPPAL